MAKIKEYTPEESKKRAREYLKRGKQLREFKSGLVFLGNYDAKDKKQAYDKRPLVLILRVKGTHVLGLNFHWIPYTFRMKIVKIILEANKDNIKNNKPLVFSDKLALKIIKSNKAYKRCTRLYIRGRFKKGTLIQPEYLLDVARLNNAIFSKPVKI